METTVSIHHGSYDSIPPGASPGLRFLQRFLPALDTLDPAERPISRFFTPDAPIVVGSNPPSAASQAVPLLEVRGRHLSHFQHRLQLAWDIDLGDGAIHPEQPNLPAPLPGPTRMKRTIMFEAVAETIFKNDPDQFPIQVSEFNVLELEGCDEPDLQVVEMRTFLDSRPVQARAASLHMESAFGESQREAQ